MEQKIGTPEEGSGAPSPAAGAAVMRLVSADPEVYFAGIRADELEILEQLTPLENYAVDEHEDLVLDGTGRPVVASYNPPTRLRLPPSNRFAGFVNDRNGTVAKEVLHGYQDVFLIDTAHRAKGRLLQAWDDRDLYQGCVWVFEDARYFGIYGIRSSLTNTLTGVRGVASRMLHLLMDFTGKPIVVPWPLPPMKPILRRAGFVEVTTQEEDEVRRFLAPYTTTSTYWIKHR